MLDLLDRVPNHDVAAVVLTVVAGFATLGIFIAYYWAKVRRTEIEAALKHDMLQRGMTAEDIERVLRASQAPAKPPAPACDHSPTGLASQMATLGYDGDDIAAVLKALDERGTPLTADEFAVVNKMVVTGYDGDDIVSTIRALPRPAPAPAAPPEARTLDGVIPRGFVGVGAVILSKKRPEGSAIPTPR